jgi:tRNA A37 threonylcarbamoyladenosine synthetase subunit TsaC/SUA5/YrdC
MTRCIGSPADQPSESEKSKVSRLQIEADAERAFGVLAAGGIAILPMDVGYSLIGGSLERIFATKRRADTKLNAMLGHQAMTREVHLLSPRERDIAEAITIDYDLPLGLVAPARMDHPLLAKMDAAGRARSTRDGTVCMLLNAGPFHDALCRLSLERGHPLFGSSANRSLQGTKFRVEDIEPEVRAIADVTIDHGLRKYHLYRASSTLIDIRSMTVIRVGACYELIADALRRWFDIDLPAPPPGFLPERPAENRPAKR